MARFLHIILQDAQLMQRNCACDSIVKYVLETFIPVMWSRRCHCQSKAHVLLRSVSCSC